MEKNDPLEGLAAKLDEMQREVLRHFHKPRPKKVLPLAEKENADARLFDGFFSFFFRNRR